MVDAIAFLPVHDVALGVAYLKNIASNDDEKAIIDYFDSSYVSGTYRIVPNNNFRVRLRRNSALFTPELWNVNVITIRNLKRTNNDTEGWNNRFKHLIGYSHPNIYDLIKKIRLEIAVDETKISQAELGKSQEKKKRKKYETTQAQLRNVCLQYNAGQKTLEDFLRAVAHHIRFV